MSNGAEHDKLIEFKAEVKSDVKYLRVDINKLTDAIISLTKKVNNQCTEIAVLKTKVAIYAGGIATIISIVAAILSALLKG